MNINSDSPTGICGRQSFTHECINHADARPRLFRLSSKRGKFVLVLEIAIYGCCAFKFETPDGDA
jgi:hypothetical protein